MDSAVPYSLFTCWVISLLRLGDIYAIRKQLDGVIPGNFGGKGNPSELAECQDPSSCHKGNYYDDT